MSSEFLEALQAACESSDASLEFLDVLDGPTFLERLIQAEAADSDYKLTIPGFYPLANAVIQKFSEARLAVTGETFDAAWSVVAFNFDYGMLGGEVFQPAMFSNGAILIRNHHRVIGIDDRSALRRQPCENFPFSARHRVHRTQSGQVCAARVVDDGDIWSCQLGQVFNFSRMAHTHLDHRIAMNGPQLKQGKWHTDVIIEISKRC